MPFIRVTEWKHTTLPKHKSLFIPCIDALNKDTLPTESNFKFTKNSFQNTLESISENFDDHKNVSFPIFKNIKSKHPKNLFFGH